MKKNNTFLKVIVIVLLSLLPENIHAQCDINIFTATQIEGSCVQDGAVNVEVTGATDCSIQVFAYIRETGASQNLDFISLTTTGTGTFLNLAPGNYDVLLKQGSTVSSIRQVTVSSTYVPMVLTTNSINTTCSSSDSNNPTNGEVSISITGGTGPFTYELILEGVIVQTSGSITATNNTFNNLGIGNYNVSVTDNNATCTSQEIRGATVVETIYIPMYYYYERIRPDEDTCGLVTYRVAVGKGNSTITGLGSVTASSAILNGTVVYGKRKSAIGATSSYFEFKGLVPGDTLSNITVTDGCNTVTRPDLVIPTLPNNYLDYFLVAVKNSDCSAAIDIQVDAGIDNGFPVGRSAFAFQVINTLSLYKEDPVGSGSFVFVDSKNNVSHLSLYGGSSIFTGDDPTATYKLVAEDDCHTVERIFTPSKTYNNPLLKATLQETNSMLEGTSSFLIRKNGGPWGSTDSFNWPITAVVTPTDGTTSTTINPTHPYSQAGTYTYSFPLTAVYHDNDGGTNEWHTRSVMSNLPLGEYEVKLTDACGDSVTNIIDLVEPVTYSPSITIVPGCAASDVLFDLGATHVTNYTKTRLYTNNGGSIGSLVRDFTENPSNTNVGQFSAVPPGDYIMYFSDFAYRDPTLPSIGFRNAAMFDAAQMAFDGKTEFQVPITVAPYEPVAFNVSNLFCDSSDDDSGIMAISATGIPVGEITYSVWVDTLNPTTDTPTQTYTTTTLTEMSHVFQNLSVGTYKVRVITDCGFTEQTVTLQQGTSAYPSPTATDTGICLGENTTLSIGLPTSIYDITWKDGSVTIGTGSSVVVTPATTTTYTVEYALSTTLGCSSTAGGSDTIEIVIHTNVALNSDPTTTFTTCQTNGSYQVTIDFVGTAPFTIVGTGGPGIWSGTTWTSNDISTEVDYNVNVEDVNACNTLNVTGTAPEVCCLYEVNCPAFPRITVECASDVPTVSTLGIAQFEALGYGNGSIGDFPCGIIEITANNSISPTYNGTIIRTYTVTEYEDANNNNVRDPGENTILNTTDCTRIYSILDTVAPTGTAPADITGLECISAIPVATIEAITDATDNCGGTVNITVADINNGATGCNGSPYIVTRTYTLTDIGGLTTDLVQTITVEDTIAPTGTAPADITGLECISAIP
ncbi:MAG: hypothetical protein JKY08_06105, partial [Flavobacteriaceae bacterium]|nr:hypothetical protein [Flavobacteriaceae bacterium]